MAIQPSITFGRNGRELEPVDNDDRNGATVAETEKNSYPPADRTPSVSSYNSDEKQTFGVAKVEAVTSVWTKRSLIVLYVLYKCRRKALM